MGTTNTGHLAAPREEHADGSAETLVREPRQDRSRRTLRRILEAGLYLVEHEGPDALTVTAITKRARTSVGSFYARFQGKDDLLRYLGERALNETLAVWSELSEGLEPNGDLRSSASELVERLGWLYLEGAGRPMVLLDGIEDPRPTRRQRFEKRLAADIRDLGLAASPRSDLTTRVLTGILRDSARRAMEAGSGPRHESADPEGPELLSELVELVVGYMGGEVREVRRDDPAPDSESIAPAVDEPAPRAPTSEPEGAGEPEREAELVPESISEAPVDGAETLDEPHEAKREIETDDLIQAALSTEAGAAVEPPDPPPERSDEPLVSEAPPEEEVRVADELEEQAAATEDDEPSPEVADSLDPDPFDVWE